MRGSNLQSNIDAKILVLTLRLDLAHNGNKKEFIHNARDGRSRRNIWQDCGILFHIYPSHT